MNEIIRQGMIKSVRVREYNDEAKFLVVEIKAPTELPVAQWTSGSAEVSRHVDEISMAVPLDSIVRPGDVVAMHIQISNPFAEGNRFRPALEVGDTEADVLEVMVEDSLINEAKEDE